jgi:hypothetical protein
MRPVALTVSPSVMCSYSEHHRADRVALEVQREAEGVAGELQHFALHDAGEAMDAGDAVGDGDHRALVARRSGELQVLDPALDQVADLRRVELHICMLLFL